jgi:ELWxxDGT repeat protein
LWASDGTPAGTRLVKDIAPGLFGDQPRASAPYGAAVLGDRVYFVAYDGVSHTSLWVTDGTPEGTSRVFDPHPDAVNGGVSPPLASGAFVYFTSFVGPNTFELWRTDGTPGATVKVRDFRTDPDAPDSWAATWSSLGDGSILLAAPASDSSPGYELWRSDGTPDGTVLVKDILPGPQSSRMGFMTRSGGSLYFTAVGSTDAGTGQPVYGLWKTDGTAAGTVPVLEQVPGSAFGLSPGELADLNGT